MRRKHHTGEAGRTLPELLVAMAILAMVVTLLSSMQISIYRRASADQTLGDVIRPVRDAVDHIAREVEIAFNVSTPSDSTVDGGKYLKLRQVVEGQKRVVYFWMDRDQLVRGVQSVSEWSQADPSLSSPRTVVNGVMVIPFELPFRMVGTGTVRVYLQATADGGITGSETRELQVDVVSRKEVGRCTEDNPC